MSARMPWVILTGEFPPASGGVGDYSAQLAASLAAAGDEVTVYRPPADAAPVMLPGVRVLTLPDHFGVAARSVVAQRLEHERARVLVQYVPQAFGLRGANVAFCRWLHARSARGDDVRVMFHEPYFYLSFNPRHAALAAVQRGMAAILLRSSMPVYVSTESWRRYLSPYARKGFDPITLPIPSTIPAVDRPACVAAARARLLNGGARVIGHFGTYGAHIAPSLEETFINLLQHDTSLIALCIGARSEEFVRRVEQRAPGIAGRLHATGRLSAEDVAVHLQCCDVVVQPYPDGVTTRRTSVMAALANRRAVVTTTGELTEPVWSETNVAALARAGDTVALARTVRHLLDDDASRASLAARAATIYAQHFAIGRTVATLRDGTGACS